jgi:hypothetical protein
MRFDTIRMLAVRPLLGAGSSRPSGVEKTADVVAGLLEDAGCQVSRTEVTGSLVCHVVRVVLPRLVVASCFLWASWRSLIRPPCPLTTRVVALAVGILGLAVIPGLVRRLCGVVGGRSRSVNIVGRRPTSGSHARVVFLTTLDQPLSIVPGRWQRLSDWGFRLTAASIAVISLFDWTNSSPTTRGWLFGIAAAALVGCMLIGWLARLRPFNHGEVGELADALATIVEMAKAWPKRWDSRVEALFAATGGTFDRSGLTAMVRDCLSALPKTPTLIVGIWSPGLGPPFGLVVNSLEAGEDAVDAAEGLRLPHRVFGLGEDDWLGDAGRLDFAGLTGLGPVAEGDNVEPAAFHHAAQLATEIALRWARRADADAASQAPGESLARSSQNPG